MTLRPAFRRTAVGLLLLSTGCVTASTGRDSLLSRMSAFRSTESGKKPPEQEVPEQEEPGSDPDSPLASLSDEPKTPVRETGLSATRPARKLDAATMMLIETELKDCPPAERDQWLALLQSLPPESVPHVLQARRMQAAKSETAPTGGLAQHSATSPDGSIVGNGHSASPPTASAPRLEFEAYDGSPDAPRSGGGGLAARLNAPDPSPSSNVAGVSPFGRKSVSRESSTPTRRTSFDGLLTRTDARPPDSLSNPAPETTPLEMPTIAPNQPRAVSNAVDSATGFGRLEPGRSLGSPPVTGVPPTTADASSLNSATLQSGYWQDALQRLTALVEAEAAARQPGLTDAERIDYVKQQVWLRMLYLMADEPQRAQAAIPGLNPSEQEFWTALFWAVSNYFDGQALPDAAERAALTLQQLDYAQSRLEQQAALQLKNVSFCYKINSFGNFESWQRDAFRPGQTVLLYAEVSNFASRPTPQGQFTTRLKSIIEIRRGSAEGEVLEQNALSPTEDVCRSPRRDYFHSYTIDLPQYLSPGPYTLVLKVEDEYSGKTATHPISFLIQ
ncbi:MAG: hypothetical protein U0992_10980 [Planctomycetaceae bacterium]